MASIKSAMTRHPIAMANNARKAKSGFAAGDYEKAGKYSGKDVKYVLDAAHKIVDGDDNTVTELEQFTDHFWLHAFDINLRLEGCVKNTKSSIKVVEKSIALIKDHSNPLQVALSINYIRKHYADVFEAFDACTKAAPDLWRGVSAMKPLFSISTATSAAKSATIHHPISFPRNLKRGQSAISEGRWDDAGDYFGDDVHYMLDEIEDEEAVFMAQFRQ